MVNIVCCVCDKHHTTKASLLYEQLLSSLCSGKKKHAPNTSPCVFVAFAMRRRHMVNTLLPVVVGPRVSSGEKERVLSRVTVIMKKQLKT
jgi:hypothetical protein